MNKAFEKIRERLQKLCEQTYYNSVNGNRDEGIRNNAYHNAIDIINQVEAEYNNGWIPCSERLPEERDWCLAVFEEVDTGFIGIPYIAEYLMGKHTIATTEDGWIIHNCTDREDASSEYYKKLRCVAWQPLPEPIKESD